METKREVAAVWVCSLTTLLVACGGERGETSAAQGKESTEATESALGLPDLWATRDDPRQVWRIDPDSGNLFDRTMIEETPHDVVFLDDAVWIAAESGKILKMDPESRTILSTLDAGVTSPGLAAGHGALWVTGQGKVLRVDPATATIAAEIPVRATELIAGEHDVYAVSGASVVRLDPATNAVAARADLGKRGGYGYGEIAVGPTGLWLLDEYSDRLYALDPATLQVRLERAIPDAWDGELAAGSESLFIGVHQRDSARVAAVNPADASVRFEIAVDDYPDQLVVVNGILIVTPGAFGELRFFDERNGNPRGELPGEYAEAMAVAAGGAN